MNKRTYPIETLSKDDDDGIMPDNVADLASLVIGKRIVSAEVRKWEARKDPDSWHWRFNGKSLVLTLDDGTAFAIENTDDCCAYTELKAFIYHPDKVNNVITAVETEDGYTKWHVLADGADVLALTVDWSCGNPFYYGYGFDFRVVEVSPT